MTSPHPGNAGTLIKGITEEMGEKKSWREIDRERDHSSYRQESRPSGRAPRIETATAEYKRQLDAFFDRGVIPDSLKGKLPAKAEGESPSERTQLLRAVREAESGKPLVTALDKLKEKGPLPEDPEILLRALEHPKDSFLLDVLDVLEKMVSEGKRLPKKNLLIQKLKGLEFSSFDPRVQTRAPALASKLS